MTSSSLGPLQRPISKEGHIHGAQHRTSLRLAGDTSELSNNGCERL